MPQTSLYCKAYPAKRLRAFSAWVENTSSLRKGLRIEDGKHIEYDRKSIEPDDVLYLHDSLIVTDGVFKDEHVIFDQLTSEWRDFCENTLQFKVPDYLREAATATDAK